MSGLYPVFLRLEGRRCVVVGGGRVAARKVQKLLAAGADVLVVAPRVSSSIDEAARAGRVALARRTYEQGDLENALLVFAATDDPETNRRVDMDARATGALVNRVDQIDAGDFLVPASIDRDRLSVAISTSGRSPGLARALREELELWLTSERAELLDLVAEVREELKQSGRNPNGAIWRRAIDGALVDLDGSTDRAGARRRLLEALDASELVGAR